MTGNICIPRRRCLMLAGSVFLSLACDRSSRAAEYHWEAVRSGQAIVLMRHAEAPGTGDPEGFRLGDCSTQRNLSQAGRSDARAIGELLARNGISSARIYSSQWCRCLDTARLLGLGPVTEQPLLNSFFDNRGNGGPKTKALEAWLIDQSDAAPLILVTHQVNITALTGVFPASGELIIISRPHTGKIRLLDRITTADH